MTTSVKGASSLHLHRYLGVTQKTAWHLAHRIREAWKLVLPEFDGPVEVDEAYMGGKEKNKHADKKLHSNWRSGKTIVASVKDRDTNRVSAEVVTDNDQASMEPFVFQHTHEHTEVYTDEASAYNYVPNRSFVTHSIGHYVDGDVHTNGSEGG